MSDKTFKSSKKLFAWGGLIIAGLVLIVGFALQEQGKPLPEQVTDYAENVVATSVVELGLNGGELQLVEATATPYPTRALESTQAASSPEEDVEDMSFGISGNGDAPWVGADSDFDYYVLALSWQPAFCETKPNKPECETQTTSRYDAQNFALHGLWPNLENDPNHTFGYCNVSQAVISQDEDSDWCAMPALSLSDDVWSDLTALMPGATSCLHNHEWYKHGTCAGMSAEAYFALTNYLTAMFSQTAFDDYVADHIGETVGRNELLNKFADEFGSSARDYLSLRCSKVDGVSLLTEIQIALRPDIPADADFSALFPADDIAPNGSCPTEFTIDAAGLDNF